MMAETKMKAVVFSDTGKYEITERDIPEIQNSNDVKIRVLAASICGTDVHILGNPPGVDANKGIILGHECVGEVVDIGEGVRGLAVGDHVIMDNNLPCGVCPACRAGRPNICMNMQSMGVHIDGIFAKYAVAPETAYVKISKDIPIKKAIFAEPLNCVMGAVKKLKVMPGDTVVVLGCGPIALYFIKLLKAAGAGRVLVSGTSAFRNAKALESGADKVVNPKESDLKEAVLDYTEGLGADIVVDAVGSLLAESISVVRKGGQVMLFGLNANANPQIHQYDITGNDLTIYGNFVGLNTLVNVANLLTYSNLDFENLITHELPLEEFETGLQAMRDGSALEVILYP